MKHEKITEKQKSYKFSALFRFTDCSEPVNVVFDFGFNIKDISDKKLFKLITKKMPAVKVESLDYIQFFNNKGIFLFEMTNDDVERYRHPKNKQSFKKELEQLLNKHSMENGSDTQDFVLAEFMMGCLKSFNKAVVKRDELTYGIDRNKVIKTEPL